MTELVAGLTGAAIGIGLFWLGRLTAGRGRRSLMVMGGKGTWKDKSGPTLLPLSAREWEAFLKYDGTGKNGEEAKVNADKGR